MPCHYTGLDIAPYLLERAEETLTRKQIPHTLYQHDLILEPLNLSQQYDLIVLFGVMHHLPSFEKRRQLLEILRSALRENGLLVVTFWNFYELPRFRQRIVPWTDEKVPQEYHQLIDLEPNDYLLDWRQGENALRYCHYADPPERKALLDDFLILADYVEDTCNQYFVTR